LLNLFTIALLFSTNCIHPCKHEAQSLPIAISHANQFPINGRKHLIFHGFVHTCRIFLQSTLEVRGFNVLVQMSNNNKLKIRQYYQNCAIFILSCLHAIFTDMFSTIVWRSISILFVKNENPHKTQQFPANKRTSEREMKLYVSILIFAFMPRVLCAGNDSYPLISLL
jgi:hypothetical protein